MYSYKAIPVRVIDGDTVKLTVDCGFRLSFTDNFRLWGIDAPDLIAEGKLESTDFLQSLLFKEDGTPRQLSIETLKPDKFGRWLVKIWITGHEISESTMINNIMVYNFHAVDYMR